MANGTIIAESLRPDAELDGVAFTVTGVRRVAASLSGDQRANGLPATWTLLEVEVGDEQAPALAGALATVLDEPGWYADLRTEERAYVVFSGRVLAYVRADATARERVEAYARTRGIPDDQIDWP